MVRRQSKLSSPVTNTLSSAARLTSLERAESPAAAITLTRTSTFTMAANAFTTVTWQSQVRGQGITWSGSTITIPTSGYYLWSLQYSVSAVANGYFQLQIGGTTIAHSVPIVSSVIPTTLQAASLTRYFDTGDAVTLRIYSVAAVTVNVNATGSANESPILNVIQLTRAVV